MSTSRDLTAQTIRTSASASAGVLKLTAGVALLGLWLIVAAPYGDRRAGVPEDPQTESPVTRGLQWLSAWAWGLLLVPAVLAIVVFSVAPLLGIVAAPALLLAAPVILGRRAAAARGVAMPGRAVLGALGRMVRESVVGRVVGATVVVAPAVALVAWRMDRAGTAQAATFVAYAAWLLIVREALAAGTAFGDAELAARYAHAQDAMVLTALPGCTATTIAESDTRLIRYPDDSIDIVDLPEGARLRMDAVLAALEARYPGHVVVDHDAPSGHVSLALASEEDLLAREVARATGGLAIGAIGDELLDRDEQELRYDAPLYGPSSPVLDLTTTWGQDPRGR